MTVLLCEMYKRRKRGASLDLQLLDSSRVHAKLVRCSEFPVGFPHKYLVKKNTYIFPVSDVSVLERARSLGVEVLSIPDYVYVVPPLLGTLPCPSLAGLYPFQREGVLRALSWGRAALFDEMGLGKTVQALMLLRHYGGRFLVICPSYLTLNWVREGVSWGVEMTRVRTGRCPIPSGGVVMSYDLAAKRVSELGSFRTVVCDESHYLKSHKTKRTRRLKPLVLRTPHAFLLSGTPAANRPVELYSQVSMLRPECWGTYTKFVERYCGAKRSPLGFVDVSGATHRPELAFRLKQVCMIRRLKRDVLTDLPAKTRARVDLPCTGSREIRVGRARWEEINGLEPDVPARLVLERQRLVSELFRATCAAKLSSVRRYLEDLPPNVIVFAYHQAMLDLICGTLECVRVDGSTPMEERQPLLDRFVSGEVPYAALSIKAAGTGLTITSCSTVVFAELYFVPGDLLQAEDRVHRIGQTLPVDVRYLCADNTLDDHVWRMVQRKLRVTDSCLDARSDRKF